MIIHEKYLNNYYNYYDRLYIGTIYNENEGKSGKERKLFSKFWTIKSNSFNY